MVSLNYMQNLIENILDRYKVNNQVYSISKREIDFVYFVTSVIEEAKYIFSDKNQKVKIFSKIKTGLINLDILEIKRVINNLISNSSKYSPENSQIIIRLFEQGDCLGFSIENAGCNFDIKDSEKISDFLRLIQASKAVLYYEDVKILREQKNMTNRLNNCEQANIDKMINTCNNQINDINLIDEELGLDFLDEKIKEACVYRLKYPETSLQELSEIISLETGKTITKSGLNHRFRKIREIAQKIRETKKGN